jgi:hypothetical protein
MRRVPIILASGVFFLWLGLGGTEAAFGPARLAQPEGFLTQAQYYPGWRWHAYHPGWRWRYAYPGWRWHRYPGWRWRHPGWRWGY